MDKWIKPDDIKLVLIAAVDANGAIGAGGVLPWSCPQDMRHFVTKTMDRVLIMGRTTADGLPKALRGRTCLVLTRDPTWSKPGFIPVATMDDACAVARMMGHQEIWCIGGGMLYAQLIDQADVVHLTQLDIVVPNPDTWFPMDRLGRFDGVSTGMCVDPAVHFWVFSPKPQSIRACRGVAHMMDLNQPIGWWVRGD